MGKILHTLLSLRPAGFAETREWSQQLRADVETLVRTACTDLTRHWKKTNTEFKDHVSNMMDVTHELKFKTFVD